MLSAICYNWKYLYLVECINLAALLKICVWYYQHYSSQPKLCVDWGRTNTGYDINVQFSAHTMSKYEGYGDGALMT